MSYLSLCIFIISPAWSYTAPVHNCNNFLTLAPACTALIVDSSVYNTDSSSNVSYSSCTSLCKVVYTNRLDVAGMSIHSSSLYRILISLSAIATRRSASGLSTHSLAKPLYLDVHTLCLNV